MFLSPRQPYTSQSLTGSHRGPHLLSPVRRRSSSPIKTRFPGCSTPPTRELPLTPLSGIHFLQETGSRQLDSIFRRGGVPILGRGKKKGQARGHTRGRAALSLLSLSCRPGDLRLRCSEPARAVPAHPSHSRRSTLAKAANNGLRTRSDALSVTWSAASPPKSQFPALATSGHPRCLSPCAEAACPCSNSTAVRIGTTQRCISRCRRDLSLATPFFSADYHGWPLRSLHTSPFSLFLCFLKSTRSILHCMSQVIYIAFTHPHA